MAGAVSGQASGLRRAAQGQRAGSVDLEIRFRDDKRAIDFAGAVDSESELLLGLEALQGGLGGATHVRPVSSGSVISSLEGFLELVALIVLKADFQGFSVLDDAYKRQHVVIGGGGDLKTTPLEIRAWNVELICTAVKSETSQVLTAGVPEPTMRSDFWESPTKIRASCPVVPEPAGGLLANASWICGTVRRGRGFARQAATASAIDRDRQDGGDHRFPTLRPRRIGNSRDRIDAIGRPALQGGQSSFQESASSVADAKRSAGFLA